MSVEFPSKEKPKMRIDKIILCGFSAVKDKKTIELDKHTNLFMNEKELKPSVPLAIDFLLNPMYEDSNLALKCRYRGIPEQNNQSSVELHILDDAKFDFGPHSGTHLTLKRRVSKNEIHLVEYTIEEGKDKFKSKMNIDSLHAELSRLKFLRIKEPIVSERTRPTNIELNQMYINAIHLKEALTCKNLFNSFKITDHTAHDAVYDIMDMDMQRVNKAQEYLLPYRTTESALLIKGINENQSERSLLELFDDRNHKSELDLQLQVDNVKVLQRKRFESYQKALQTENETIRCDPIHLPEFSRHFDAFMTNWEKLVQDMKNSRDINAKIEAYHAILATQRNISSYFMQKEPVTDHIAMCDKYIDCYQRGFEGIYGHIKYKKCQEFIENTVKKLKDRHDAVQKEIGNLKQLEQRLLTIKLEAFQQSHEFLLCTNRLALDEINIEEFLQRQKILIPMHVEAWRHGLLTLTSSSALSKEIHKQFVGNVLDFVNPNITDSALDYVIYLACKFFTLFLFETKEASKDFLEEINPKLTSGLEIRSAIVRDEGVQEMPFESLADILLTKKTCEKFPRIKNWFDHLRVCKGYGNLTSSQMSNLAAKYKCTIIRGNEAFDGTYSEIFNEKDKKECRQLLIKWQKIAMVRNSLIKIKEEKFKLEPEMNKQKKIQNEHVKKIRDVQQKLLIHFGEFSNDMRYLFELTNALDQMEKKAIENKVQFMAYQEKRRLLQAGNQNPTIETKQMPNISLFDSTAAVNAMKEFGAYTINIGRNIAENVLQLESDAMEKYKHDIAEKQNRLNELQTFDYEKQMHAMVVESQRETCKQVDEMITNQNVCIESEKILWNRYYEVTANASIINVQQAKQLSDKSFAELHQLNDQILATKPYGLIIPEPDANIESFLDYGNALAEHDAKDLNYMKTDEMKMVKKYFDGLIEILQEINRMIQYLNVTIGIEVDCNNTKTYLFPDTEFDLYDRYSLESLCDNETGLSFVGKYNNNDSVIVSDFLEIKSHRFSFLFYLLLSMSLNPSVLVLNNSIIGHPVQQLNKILNHFQLRYEDGNEFGIRQIIVVLRDPEACNGLFDRENKLF